jgi:hypothetical protein
MGQFPLLQATVEWNRDYLFHTILDSYIKNLDQVTQSQALEETFSFLGRQPQLPGSFPPVSCQEAVGSEVGDSYEQILEFQSYVVPKYDCVLCRLCPTDQPRTDMTLIYRRTNRATMDYLQAPIRNPSRHNDSRDRPTNVPNDPFKMREIEDIAAFIHTVVGFCCDLRVVYPLCI